MKKQQIKAAMSGAREVVSAITPPKKAKKPAIKYKNGIGWDEETGQYHVHFRVGKRTYHFATGTSDEDKAKEFYQTQRNFLERQASGAVKKDLTMDEGFQCWLDEAKACEDRKRCVATIWRLWVLPLLGKKLVRHVRRKDLQAVLDIYMQTPSKHGIPHRERGMRNLITDINAVMNWLYKDPENRKVAQQPSTLLMPKFADPPVHALAAEEIPDAINLWDRIVGYDLYAMLYLRFMMFMGYRGTEIREVTKDMISRDLKVLQVEDTKGKEVTPLPIPEEIRSMLQRVPDIQGSGYLFANPDGTPRGPNWCNHALKGISFKLKLNFSFRKHKLRSTFATSLARSGVEPFVIQQWLRHASQRMVRRYVAAAGSPVLAAAQGRMMEHVGVRPPTVG